MTLKRNVVFIRRLAKPTKVLGAAFMRGQQLVDMVRPHLDAEHVLTVLPFHAALLPGPTMFAFAQMIPRDSTIIFVKSAARGLSRQHLEPLWKRGTVIGFDSVDTPIHEIDFDLFDFHIAASISGQKAIRERLLSMGMNDIPVELLLHHADPRLRVGGVPSHVGFSCGYVGQPENLSLPDDLGDEVETLFVKYPADFSKRIGTIRTWSMHYIVRPDQQNSDYRLRAFKPFTKGAIAAACGANVLVQRETDDAVELLGEDYPYLVDGTNGAAISETFRRAKADFGGKIWLEGIERMRQLDAAVSGKALAARMTEILDRVSGVRVGRVRQT